MILAKIDKCQTLVFRAGFQFIKIEPELMEHLLFTCDNFLDS